MQCFCMNIQKNQLIVTATDAELTLTASAELISSEGDFSFAINAKKFTDAVKDLPEQPISIDLNEENMEVVVFYQNGKYTLMGLSAEDFPQREKNYDNISKIKITGEALSDGLARTIFAASNDDFKPTMCGVFLDVHTDNITFVSTDTHRMVRYILYNFSGEKESSFILPKRPANLLKTILPKNEIEINIEFDKKRAQFSFDKYILDCTLTEGTYPKYQAVIPKSSPYSLRIDKGAFIAALKRVSVCSNEVNNLIKLELSDNQVKLIAQDADYSTSAEEIVSAQYEGEPLRVGFKSPFLMELINNVVTQEVRIDLTDSTRAGVLTPVDGGKEVDMLMLLMPMMIK